MDTTNIARFIAIPRITTDSQHKAAFLLSGYGISASQGTLPLLYNLPVSIASQVFKGVYYNGAAFVAPAAITSSLAFAYLAYSIPSQRPYYATASACILGTQVWTVGVMLKGINRMIEISGSAVEQKAEANGEALKLIKAWVWQNYVRAVLNLSGGFVGLWAWFNGV